uniref:Endothelial cell adhesion molecule n=1 Tax=Callorhinchus milii TaxID=7868 RepID=V9KUN8_CALMI
MALSQVQHTLFISLLVSMSLFTGLGLSASLVKMSPTQWVAIGNPVVLTASFHLNQQQIPPFSVNWQFQSSGTPGIVLIYSADKVILGSEYQDRVGFVHKMRSTNVSIYLNSTKLKDSGQYTCTVSVPDLSLVDLSVTNLSVLVPPSIPKCSTNGNHHVGSNVTLTCGSAKGDPKPIYTWKRISPKPQTFFPSHNRDKGTFTLTNVTKEMSGLYSCKAGNKAGNATCFIQMDVTYPVKLGMIVGAVVGLIMAVCLVFLTVTCYHMYQKRKKAEKEEDRANEIKEDAQPPTGNTWAKNNNSSMISKNGTLSSVTSTLRSHKPFPTMPASDTASSSTVVGGKQLPNTGRQYSPSSRSPSTKSAPRYASTKSAYGPTGPPGPQWQNGAQPQTGPRQAPTLPSMTLSNLSRMGAVPVMVPAQNQAGSLV